METKPKTASSGEPPHGAHGMDVLAPNAHGEELREVGEEGQQEGGGHRDWKHELEGLLKQLSDMIARAGGKGPEKHGAGGAVGHPLVVAAVITGLITGGSSLLLHVFQDREARNQRANELYKSKLDFVSVFGDAFPRALNALYLNQSEMIWLKCYPVSYYADIGDDAAAKTYAELTGNKPPPEEAAKAKESHRAAFDESARARLQEKKPTAMCAQALALFSREEGEDIRKLLKTVREIQDLADDPKPPKKWERTRYGELNDRLARLHDDANELFAKVLETLGTQLGESEPRK